MKVGLELVLGENGASGRVPRYREIRDMARVAEAAGFESLWLYDHLLYRDDGGRPHGIWEGWTMLAALAEATARVEIGTLVTCTAFRNPALLAKMASTLDEVSAGRLTLGLGAGWNQAEFAAFGVPFDARVSRFEEALRIVVPLLREGRLSFAGIHHRVSDCTITPAGPRPAGLPILVAAFGPRMLRLAARYADGWNGGYVADPGDLAELRQALLAACADVGRDPASLAVTAELKVAYPDLAPPPPLFADRYATGSPQALAGTLRAFAAAGFAHLMCTVSPHTPEGVARLGAAVRLFHAAGGDDHLP